MKVAQEEGVGNLWWQIQLVASLGNAKYGLIFNIVNIEKIISLWQPSNIYFHMHVWHNIAIYNYAYHFFIFLIFKMKIQNWAIVASCFATYTIPTNFMSFN